MTERKIAERASPSPGTSAAERFGAGDSVSRRALLRGAGVGALLIGVGGVTGRSLGWGPAGALLADQASGPRVGSAFVMPDELRSSGGRLDVTLVARASRVPWGTGKRYALTYGGSTPGPTLRVRPGDELTVTLRNDLDEATNLHTHGLHVSPDGDSDNVFVMVDPGKEHTYRYEIPKDHLSGTFWYHPHNHGNVAPQLFGGLAGAIVVEDDVDTILQDSTDRVIVLADPRVGASAAVLAATRAEKMMGREGDVLLVNGQLQPTISAEAGSIERWRIINASPSRYYQLSVDGAPMHWIASDQGRFDRPRTVSRLLLTPGQRAEVAIPLVGTGTLTLSTTTVDRGSMGMGGGGMGNGGMRGGTGRPSTQAGAVTKLLTVDVTPSTRASAAVLPERLRQVAGDDASPVDRSRTVTLGAMGMGTRQFVIDGSAFDPNRIDITARLGTTEAWTIRNSSMMDHPFHLHVWPFRVTARSDGTELDPGWRDTVNVPAGATVSLLVPFTDYGGKTVYHCHILDHEDYGMMGSIEVV
jgi:FtsP/CotA-like multicopper oxidase with cupredoxin domain